MNKSKFLKKSLAMLLALMLVVAMIPLSAAAAQQPAISQAWVSDGSKARLDISGSDITGSISESARSFDLEFMVSGDVTAFYYYDQSQSNAPQKKVTLNGSTATISGLNVLDYEDESGNIVVRVSAANSVGTADYTVTLTPAAVSVNTDIDTLYVGVVTGSSKVPTPQLGPTTFDGTTIKVTVPYKDLTDGGYYIIQTLELASETAVAKYIDKNGADQGVIVPGETKVEDGGIISVTNNVQTKNYPLEITVAYGVTSLSFKEAVDTIVFPGEERIAVLLPYGYSSDPSNVSNGTYVVTPEFELDYPSATATWTNAASVVSDLESGEEVKINTANTNTTIGGSLGAFMTYADPKDNNSKYSWNYRKTNFDKWFDTAKNEGFLRNATVKNDVEGRVGQGGDFTIHYSDTTERTYEVYFFETQQNDKAVIESLTIGSETATINQDTKTIDITLPAGTNAANLQLNDPETALTIKASDNAAVQVPKTTANPNVVISTDPDLTSRNLTYNFTSSSKLDASDEVIVRIASQDGLTVNDYRLNVTVASDYVAPQLTDVALQSPDGTNFEPVEEKADGTIVFEVPYTNGVAPYGPTQRADLNGWKLFYTKTVGSSATYMDGGNKTAMPLTGSKMVIDPAGAANDNCDYIPAVADGTTGAIITVSAKASNGSIATKEYKIQINRVDPDDNSVLTSFDLGAYGTDYTYFTETFKGSVKTDEGNKSGEIVVELPWSLYQDPALLEDLSAMAKSANDKEKIFVDNGDGTLREIGQVTETVDGSIFPSKDTYNQGSGIKADGHDKNKASKEGDTPIALVVLSERAWANMTWTKYPLGGTDCYYAENWKTQVASMTGDDLNLYTEYKVWINQADPKEEATLSNMVLIDGSGWEANLNIDVNGKKISGNIPYALTSDLDADGNTTGGEVNRVYLDYTISPRAFLLAADTTGNPTQTLPTANVDTYSIPVSGQNEDVRFANINDYDEFDDYYDAHKAYLLISRDGDVYVYQDGNKVAGVTSNQLAATNEDGKKVYNVFNVDLRVNEPNTGAEFSSFALNGYTGTIDQEKDTITVTLPFGTEYTYLTPTYNVSEGATVYVDDPEWLNVPMFSGKYQVNFTAPRQFTVISESENVTTTYTVNVVVSDEFSDVKPDDWFYNNVMDAVANGYMTGEGNGIFNPMGKTTRAAFASTIANALGYEAPEDPSTVTTRFKDVPSTHWGAGAIAFCVENEIIGGYDDGTFRPDQAITRQEAAAILNNAFGLTASTDVSKFTDANRIASWATAHVAAVANAELMNGDVDGAFRPTSNLNRAELASIMMNAKNHGYID